MSEDVDGKLADMFGFQSPLQQAKFEEAQAAINRLLPPNAGSGFSPMPEPIAEQLACSSPDLGRAKRHVEFRLGRELGERALLAVGWQPANSIQSDGEVQYLEADSRSVDRESSAIGVGSDRCPVWPVNYVGSISHSRHWVWAVAAAAQYYRSLGVDTEPIVSQELAEMLQSEIGTPNEWRIWEAWDLPWVVKFTLLFSAKEAYFKLWYPLSREFLSFDDVCLLEVEQEQPGSEATPNHWNLILESPRIAKHLSSATEFSRVTVAAEVTSSDVLCLTYLETHTN